MFDQIDMYLHVQEVLDYNYLLVVTIRYELDLFSYPV